jgi:hypothetical protein
MTPATSPRPRLGHAFRLLPCVVCFSAADPVARDSVNAGILVLLGVTVVVLAGFAAFIVRIARRSRRLEHVEAAARSAHAGAVD